MPLTPNGKVDRASLPEPPVHDAEAVRSVAPRTENERILAEIWCEVLSVDAVGVHEDFFALGGHSLLATRVLARMREAFDIEVGLRAIFEFSTVAGLARVVDEAKPAEDTLALPALQSGRPLRRLACGGSRPETPPPRRRLPHGRRNDSAGIQYTPMTETLSTAGAERTRDVYVFPASFAQQRLWFLDRLEPGSSAYNIPLRARIEGDLDVRALERALSEIIERHEGLRTTFFEEDGEPYQAVGAAWTASLPIDDFSSGPQPFASVVEAAIEEANRPFDLARGPRCAPGCFGSRTEITSWR